MTEVGILAGRGVTPRIAMPDVCKTLFCDYTILVKSKQNKKPLDAFPLTPGILVDPANAPTSVINQQPPPHATEDNLLKRAYALLL